MVNSSVGCRPSCGSVTRRRPDPFRPDIRKSAQPPASFGARIFADQADHSGVFSGNAVDRCAIAFSMGWRLSGGRPSGPGSRLRRTHAPERLEIGERIVAAMHGDQQFPFALGAALRNHAADGVALGAGLPPCPCRRRTCTRSCAARLRSTPGLASSGASPRLFGEILEDLARLRRARAARRSG